MIVHYNPTIFRNVRFEQVMYEEVELYLTSPTNTFVVFNGKAEIEFEGTLPECYVYSKWYKRNKGFDPCIYSKEAYDDMINVMLKNRLNMKIAIQGHPTRGKEVIQILESLGGKNTYKLEGTYKTFYYIDNKSEIGDDHRDDFPPTYKLYTLEEFEKEFPFKIGDEVFHKGHKAIVEIFIPREKCYYICYSNPPIDGIYYTKWVTAPELKMKEERNITLTLDKAKEWYKKGGDLKEIALQAFSEKELNPLPTSWEEYCRKYGCVCLSTRYTNISLKYDALLKLEQLRDCWRQGWVQTQTDTGYRINKKHDGDYVVLPVCSFKYFLSFPTQEMAEEFFKCFKNLIETAGDLI